MRRIIGSGIAAIILGGCGGSSVSLPPKVSPYAGQYVGTYVDKSNVVAGQGYVTFTIDSTGTINGVLNANNTEGVMIWNGSITNAGQLSGWVLAIEQAPFSITGQVALQASVMTGSLIVTEKGVASSLQLTATKQ